MYILDTNVVSEIVKPLPNADVLTWLGRQEPKHLFTTAITQSEMLYGVLKLPAGRRRDSLASAVEAIFETDFRRRVLPFDRIAARFYSRLMVDSEAVGRQMSDFDAQIAAITRRYDAELVTRNSKHFLDCGVTIIDPWALARRMN